MWLNYLNVALRVMRSNPLYTLINVSGLAIGIAASILIFLYVRYETSYDRWIPRSDRIYLLQTRIKVMGPEPIDSALAPHVAAEALQREFAAIETVTAAASLRSTVKVAGKPLDRQVLLADPNFLAFFDLPILRGDRRALGDPASLVLTQNEAVRLFGAIDPLGRTVEMETEGRKRVLKVTGIISNPPLNSHLDLGMIARFNAADANPDFPPWGATDSYVYARLRPGTNAAAINARLPAFEKRNLGPFDEAFDYHLTPIRELHLGEPLQGAMRPIGDAVAVKAFAAIASLVLLIACFNFTNLTTARASQRAREVALRKALGARRRQLFQQFMAESLVFSAAGTLGALVLVELLLHRFNSLLGVELSLVYFSGNGILLPTLALALAVGSVSGFYPAVYLSGLQPSQVLRTAALAGASGAGRLRQLLVLGQFAVAIALMVCAAIVYAQTTFARQANPGFEPRSLLVIENLWVPGVGPAAGALRDEIAKLPGVTHAALSGGPLTGSARLVGGVRRPGAKDTQNMEIVSVDYGALGTLGVPIVAGRDFAQAMAADTFPEAASVANRAGRPSPGGTRFNVLLDRSAARRLGFPDAAKAVGQEVIMAQGRGDVVGIVGDVRYGSLRDPPAATVYMRDEANFGALLVRYGGTDPAALSRAAQRIWRKFAADTPFSAHFVEDDIAKYYDSDAVRGQVFAIAAALAVTIACLGLFGLSAFTIERRKLEIAIRKVFGARDRDIAALMVYQFSRPVLAANLIAWPAAWWLMRGWLNGFSERIDLHPGWFLAAGALALLIAALTTGGHALRASRAHPARILRNE
ncbi:MAG: FtsX-like permease family protein [Allosphingosinicella sp.]